MAGTQPTAPEPPGDGKKKQRKRGAAAFRRSPLRGYNPAPAWYGYGSAALDGSPVFLWPDVPRMLRDPQIRFVERMWRAPFQKVKWSVSAPNKAVAQFVGAMLRRFWVRSLPKLLSRYFRYGFAPGAAEFAPIRGRVRLVKVRAVEPLDAQARVWNGDHERAGELAGFDVAPHGALVPNNSRGTLTICSPHLFWFAGHGDLTQFHDAPPLSGCFEPWLEKRGRGGAIQSRKLWFRKAAWRGGIMYYPEGPSNVGTAENPQYVDNQDLARQALETLEAGGTMAISSDVNPATNQKKWEYQPPESYADVAGLREYPQDLDREILVGAGIPPEVLEASEVGSGWSGRMVPLMGYLGTVDELAGLLLEACDSWLGPLVALNFGENAWYEVKPQSLVDELQQQQQQGAMPGGQQPGLSPSSLFDGKPPAGGPGGPSGGGGGGDGPQQPAPGGAGGPLSLSVTIPEGLIRKAERAAGGHKYACAHVEVPRELAAQLKALAYSIPNTDLYDPAGGKGRELESHVTVRFGLLTDEAADLAPIAADAPPARVGFTGIGHFDGAADGKPYDVVFAAVDSADLRRLNRELAALPHHDTHPEYVPHATIAYVRAGAGALWARRLTPMASNLSGRDFTAPALVLSARDGSKAEVPFGASVGPRELSWGARGPLELGWTPYKGPKGGTGWVSDTGEVRYQESRPADDEGRAPSPHGRGGDEFDMPEYAHLARVPGEDHNAIRAEVHKRAVAEGMNPADLHEKASAVLRQMLETRRRNGEPVAAHDLTRRAYETVLSEHVNRKEMEANGAHFAETYFDDDNPLRRAKKYLKALDDADFEEGDVPEDVRAAVAEDLATMPAEQLKRFAASAAEFDDVRAAYYARALEHAGLDEPEAPSDDEPEERDPRRLDELREGVRERQSAARKLRDEWHRALAGVPEDERPEEPDWNGPDASALTGQHDSREDHETALESLHDEYDSHVGDLESAVGHARAHADEYRAQKSKHAEARSKHVAAWNDAHAKIGEQLARYREARAEHAEPDLKLNDELAKATETWRESIPDTAEDEDAETALQAVHEALDDIDSGDYPDHAEAPFDPADYDADVDSELPTDADGTPEELADLAEAAAQARADQLDQLAPEVEHHASELPEASRKWRASVRVDIDRARYEVEAALALPEDVLTADDGRAALEALAAQLDAYGKRLAGEGPRELSATIGPDGDDANAMVAGQTNRLMRQRKAQLARALAVAMVRVQLGAAESGDPASAGPKLAQLSALAGGGSQQQQPAQQQTAPGEMGEGVTLGPLELSWEPYVGKRGARAGQQVGWKDSETGQVRYQKSKPGEHAEKRQTRQASEERGREILRAVARKEATAAELGELVDHLPVMSVKALKSAKVMLDAKFGNSRTHRDMVNTLLARVGGLTAADGTRADGTKAEVKDDRSVFTMSNGKPIELAGAPLRNDDLLVHTQRDYNTGKMKETLLSVANAHQDFGTDATGRSDSNRITLRSSIQTNLDGFPRAPTETSLGLTRRATADDVKRLAEAAGIPVPPAYLNPKRLAQEGAKPAGPPQPGDVRTVPTESLKVDPERFQFKLGVNKEGVTKELQGVTTYNPEFAGTVLAWRDPADGTDYVVNGHHRYELAKRTGHPDMAVRWIAAKDAREARAKGALVNIAEGRGTAVDAAKFMRDAGVSPEELAKHGVSLKGKLAADAATLTKLNDKAFDRLARGGLDLERALAVSKHLSDPVRQERLFDLLAKREEAGKDLSGRTVEELARQMAAAPKVSKTESTLWGDETTDEDTFVERAELAGYVRAQLAQEMNDFGAVASQRRADRVAGAGNTLNVEENAARQTAAEEVRSHYDGRAHLKGGVSDALDAGAVKLKTAKSKKERERVRSETLEAVRTAVRGELDSLRKPADDGRGESGVDQVGGAAGAGERAAAGAEDGARPAAEPAGVETPSRASTTSPALPNAAGATGGASWMPGAQTARKPAADGGGASAAKSIDFATATPDEVDAHMNQFRRNPEDDPQTQGEKSKAYGDALRSMPQKVANEFIKRRQQKDNRDRRSRAGTRAAATRSRNEEALAEKLATPTGNRLHEAERKVKELGARYQIGGDATDAMFERAQRELTNASLAHNLYQTHKEPDVVAQRRNDELPPLNVESGAGELEATRDMNTIPWTVSHFGDTEPTIVSGARLQDSSSTSTDRVLRLYGIEPGSMAGDSQTAVKNANELGDWTIHFDKGDPAQSARARRLVSEIARGKAQNMTVGQIRQLILTGKLLSPEEARAKDYADNAAKNAKPATGTASAQPAPTGPPAAPAQPSAAPDYSKFDALLRTSSDRAQAEQIARATGVPVRPEAAAALPAKGNYADWLRGTDPAALKAAAGSPAVDRAELLDAVKLVYGDAVHAEAKKKSKQGIADLLAGAKPLPKPDDAGDPPPSESGPGSGPPPSPPPGAGGANPDRAPSAPAAGPVPDVNKFEIVTENRDGKNQKVISWGFRKELAKRIDRGEMTAAELRQHFDALTADPEGVKAGLREALKKTGMRSPDKIREAANSIYDRALATLTPGKTVSYTLSGNWDEAKINGHRRAVQEIDDAHLQQHAEQARAESAEQQQRFQQFKSALDNPQTADDFRALIRARGETALTPEQSAKWDELQATERRAKDAATRAQKATVTGFTPGAEATGGVNIVQGHHQKRNAPTFTVTVENRLGEDGFGEALNRAKQLGGSYVNARIAKAYGATPGFQFFDKAKAEQFAAVLRGESVDRTADLAQSEADRLSNRAAGLGERADSLVAGGEESLARDRLANTARRAAQAASAEADARQQIATGRTLATLSQAMAGGTVQHLNQVRSAKDVDTLNRTLDRAKYDRVRALNLPYGEQQNEQAKPHTEEDVRAAQYPYPQIWSNDLKKAAEALKDEPGLMRVAQKLTKAATEEPKFRTRANGFSVNGGRIVTAQQIAAEHPELAGMLRAEMGPNANKAFRVHASFDTRLKSEGGARPPYYTADEGKTWATSPIIAVAAARRAGNEYDLVDGPQEKLLSIDSPDDLEAMRKVVSRLRNHPNRDLRRIGESFGDRLEHYNRLQRMDIKTPAELRAALREYLPLKRGADAEDPVKKLERGLIGRKIDGFFPTPRKSVEDMLDRADIQPGMSVLEPSAGKGDILDAINERHPDAQTHAVEPVAALRDILKAKGHNLVDSDFLSHRGQYDRVVMNPPFENGQDIDHVRHAYEQLKPGGRLVAIMSDGPFSRSDKKAAGFRDWLDSVGGEHEPMEEGSFAGNDAFRQTGVRTRMVTITKPGG